MSTSDIGQEEDLKPRLEAYHFQRRMLLGCTAAVGVGLIIWIIAISTDHWFNVSGGKGIYIPETRRFFLSSHSGIWTVCRYALAPVLVANVTAARNVSLISFTNPTRIENLRHEMSKQPFVVEFLQARIENVEEITEIDNAFKQALFALWLTSNENFHAYKEKYHALSDNDKVAIKKVQPINPTHLEAIKDVKGVTLVTVNLNNTNVPILIPPRLQAVLFNYWHEKDSVVYLLGAYARELEISAEVVTSDGTKYQFQPPVPPKKGKTSFDGYDYRPFKRCRNHKMFPTDQEISDDPAIDDEIIDYNRSEASFAIITLLIMLMGIVFSTYTFLNPRYMFKRLAGGIHFISASTSFVVIQVIVAEIEYQKEFMAYNFPKNATFSYGYGYWLAWFVFGLNIFSCLTFLWYSKKKKGDKAINEELGMADEPINIGR